MSHSLFSIDNTDNWVFCTLFSFEKDDLRRLWSIMLLLDVVYSYCAQKMPAPGDEAICITLRRLAYPNRLCELKRICTALFNDLKCDKQSPGPHSWQFRAPPRWYEQSFVAWPWCSGNLWGNTTTLVSLLENFHEWIHGFHCRPWIPREHLWITFGHLLTAPSEQSVHHGIKSYSFPAINAPMPWNSRLGIICQIDGPYVGSKHYAGKYKTLIDELYLYHFNQKSYKHKKLIKANNVKNSWSSQRCFGLFWSLLRIMINYHSLQIIPMLQDTVTTTSDVLSAIKVKQLVTTQTSGVFYIER